VAAAAIIVAAAAIVVAAAAIVVAQKITNKGFWQHKFPPKIP
jgi:hypothetical protein